MEALAKFHHIISQSLLTQKQCQLSESATAEAQICRAFLVLLAGKDHPDFLMMQQKLSKFKSEKRHEPLISFFEKGLQVIQQEVDQAYKDIPTFNQNLNKAFESSAGNAQLYRLLFPEGLGLDNEQGRQIRRDELRQKRTVHNISLNPTPLTDPATEILFSSNILLTLPLQKDYSKIDFPKNLISQLQEVGQEPQLFWYDHPIPIGISTDKNEILYGLRGLNDMMRLEEVPAKSKLKVILSVSTTHKGLHSLVRPYFNHLFSKQAQLENLEIYIFTEEDTQRLLQEVLNPLARAFSPDADFPILAEIFGVDGEYGRHYSFLKALAALWQVFLDPGLKATFKIDLDQVFPQKELLEQTGKTALQHFKSPLWGAKGQDSDGQSVELGLLAGALVNQSDIRHSLYYPDLRYPEQMQKSAEELVFFSRLPQALSTAAEIMNHDDGLQYDGIHSALQRIHVTGGTTGVLLAALRRHRPFTPSFVGRAEDQAYIMSVLFKNTPALRYLHLPGLIMRHDKEAFAAEAIAAASVGKIFGDYIRILVFSDYARALYAPLERIKHEMDPFSGSFISPIPRTLVLLRFALKIMELSNPADGVAQQDFITHGLNRLKKWMNPERSRNFIKERYQRETVGWELYYDLLDAAEQSLIKKEPEALAMLEKVEKIFKGCKLDYMQRGPIFKDED